MSEILKGLAGGGWVLLSGWIFPSSIATALFSFLVFPSIDHLPFARGVAKLSPQTQALTLALIAVAIGIILSALQTPLYRLLEGYLWPQRLQARGQQKHRERKTQLAKEARELTGLPRALVLEQYRRYPADENQVAPTYLGNCIRAFETYAFDRFMLDSQLLWSELTSVVPDSLRTEVERARAGVDFFVSLLYLFAILGALSLLAAVSAASDELKLVAIGLSAWITIPLWYRLAVVSTDPWRSAVRALVNLGRKPVAEALGLEMPTDLELERQMWRRVNWLVRDSFHPEIVRSFNALRKLEPTADEGGSPPPQPMEAAAPVESSTTPTPRGTTDAQASDF